VLGTDQLGRDMLSMLMIGAQTSIAVALIAVGIGIGLGVPLGLAAAANRGSLLDEIIMRGNDLIFAFPSLVIAILITARYGRRPPTRSSPSASSTSPSSPAWPAAARCRSGRSTTSSPRAPPARGNPHFGRAHPAQHREPPDRAGHDPVLAGHPRRGRAQLCGSRRAAAHAVLGPDAERGADDDLQPPDARGPAGARHRAMVLGLNLMGDGLRDALDPRLGGAGMNYSYE
jgi:peptide/nickel transport system permease protein